MEPRKIIEGYIPFNGQCVALDAVILSYCTTQNLKATLESIEEGEMLKATFVKALEKSYQYVKKLSPKNAWILSNRLRVYSNRDYEEENVSVKIDVQDAVVDLVAYSKYYGDSLLFNSYGLNTRNALRLENYLLDAGADCAPYELPENLVHGLSVDRLGRLLATKVKYKVTDKHGEYLAESHMSCCCPCCGRVLPASVIYP